MGGGGLQKTVGLHDFSVIIPKCYEDVYGNSFFLKQRLWNYFVTE